MEIIIRKIKLHDTGIGTNLALENQCCSREMSKKSRKYKFKP